jgi:transcriptional regulator
LHPSATFLETDRAELERRVAKHGFAIVFAAADGAPFAAHAPVLLSGPTLRFHLSAVNPLTKAIAGGARTLVVVSGEDAYISPDWYGLEDQVPTWNYASVEIEGPARVLAREGAVQLLDDLSARYEEGLAPKPPWTRAKMGAARFETLLRGIVAFEMDVERLEGISKFGQNKPDEAIARVAEALRAQNDERARRIADRMFKHLAAG